MTDTRSRKWQITINNPEKNGFTHDTIKDKLADMKSLVYYCMADEKGETYHTHLYVYFQNVVRYSTLHNTFYGAHLEMAKGTSQQNRDYIAKAGKWESDEKHGTRVENTFEEYGDCPIERQGHRTDLEELYDLICSGATNKEIYEQNPRLIVHNNLIEKLRQDNLYEAHKNKFIEKTVTYVWGKTGIGKTRMLYEKHSPSDVYRVTNWKHPFDNYTGQKVLALDEFRSQLFISDMLSYLDLYPVTLPARYVDKQGCYSIVYIISNWELREQYPNIQREDPNTWQAFLRRVSKLQEITEDGVIEHDIYAHVCGITPLPDDTSLPF